MKRVVLYNCATIFTSIWVKFPQVVFIWGAVICALQAAAYLMTIVQSKLARPSFISTAHTAPGI